MAETKKSERIERVYVVPLRRHFRRAPVYKRSKRAMNYLKIFLAKHMKTEDVRIGRELNEAIFARGFDKPPHKVKITVIKEDGIAKANIEGIPYKDFKPEEHEHKHGKEEKHEHKHEHKEEHKTEEKHEHKEESKEVKEEKKEEKPKKVEKKKTTSKKE